MSPVQTSAESLIASNFVADLVWPIRPQYQNTYASLERFRRAGYDMVSVTLAGDQHNISEATQMVASHRRQVLAETDRFVLVEKLGDIDRARRENRLAIVFHFEGTRCFERNLDMVEAFFQLGIRFTLLAFNQNNEAGGGSSDLADPGLSAYGRLLVQEMDRVGMLLDISHTGRRTGLEALELYSHPCVLSHACIDALYPHPRNVTDEQIDAVAARGGIVGISGANMYHGDDECQTETLFRHLDYVSQRVGAVHVALGLDVIFDGQALTKWLRARPDEWPFAQDSAWLGTRTAVPEQLLELVGLMQAAGYKDADVVAVIGGNVLRTFEARWRDGDRATVAA